MKQKVELVKEHINKPLEQKLRVLKEIKLYKEQFNKRLYNI